MFGWSLVMISVSHDNDDILISPISIYLINLLIFLMLVEMDCSELWEWGEEDYSLQSLPENGTVYS